MKRKIKKIMLPLILCIVISGCNKKQITEETETKTRKTQTTTEYQETRTINKSSWVIELDPGHGGIDSGAVGTSHDWPQEKEINLKIAKYVKKELVKNPNIKVYLTRTGDTKPELSDRVPKAVRDKADLFISLHNNAKGQIVEYDHGCSVIVPTGNYNKEISKQAQLLGCYFLKHLQQQAGVENQGLLMRTSEKNQRYPNGKLRDYYRIIHDSIEQNIPGVIVEHAFVDSKEDVEQFLKDDNKIKKLAQADANAIKNYCLGSLKLEDEMEQKVTLIRDPKGKENEYFRINLKK